MEQNCQETCSVCNNVYSNKKSLLKHRRAIHGIYCVSKERRKNETNDCYNCSYCNKEYKIPQSRWQHEKKCKTEKFSQILKKDDEIIELKNEIKELKTLVINLRQNIKPQNNRKTIPSTVKRLVWDKFIGETIGKGKCYCCKKTDITQMSFHCGHVVSEKNGGNIEVDNLRPICQNCNSSMHTTNMNDFIQTYKLHITPEVLEGVRIM